MGIGDRLLAKTAGVAPKEIDASTATAGPPKTSPGRMMAAQAAINAVEKRLEDVQRQIGKAIELPLDKLVEVPGRRRKLTPEQYAELKDNLRQNPLVSPITVIALEDGRYEIHAGNNRTHIYRELGRTTIPAVIREFGDEHQTELAAFYSNLLQPSLPDLEKYLGLRRRQEQAGLTQQQLGDEAGLSAAQVSRLFAFSRLPAGALEILQGAQDLGLLGANGAAAFAMQYEADASSADAILNALRQMVADPSFTQAKALESVKASRKPKSPAERKAPRVFRLGKKQICSLAVRPGVIAIQLKDQSLTDDWEEKLAEFIETQLIGGTSK